MRNSGWILITVAALVVLAAASQSIQILSPPTPMSQDGVSLFEAIEIGRDFLHGINLTAGRILSTSFEVREPSMYWHVAYGLDEPDTDEPTPMWIIRFEQAARPGHYFEVWVDEGGRVLGGTQCK